MRDLSIELRRRLIAIEGDRASVLEVPEQGGGEFAAAAELGQDAFDAFEDWPPGEQEHRKLGDGAVGREGGGALSVESVPLGDVIDGRQQLPRPGQRDEARCRLADARCRAESPPQLRINSQRAAACWRLDVAAPELLSDIQGERCVPMST